VQAQGLKCLAEESMKTHVLLVDDNASRSAERRHYLVGAGVEVINACEVRQAIEVMQSHRVDVVCIDAQFVVNRGSEIGALVKCLKPFVPVVLIADDDRIPDHFEEHVDIVIDRADFDVTGRRLVQELNRGHVPFFRRWFDEWTDCASKSGRDETIRACAIV
jgi:DNA-binding NtrC family response regulator